MPIYEFYCPDNHTIYQFLARSLRFQGTTPRCPENEKFRMERRVSRFAFLRGVKEEGADDPFANVDDAKMEVLMADMERDMAGMDETNPDPRQLGHFMRKMSDALGGKLPPEMKEVLKRLESGEDPEKLESEFGDMMGDDEGAGGDMFAQAFKKIRAGMRAPMRDPMLYDMGEFAD